MEINWRTRPSRPARTPPTARSRDQHDHRRSDGGSLGLGDQIVKDMNQTIATLEQHWQQQVGAERYRSFRDVLRQITNDPPP